MTNSNQEYKELLARIEDIIDASDTGSLSKTKFLSPAEAFYAKKILNEKGLMHRAFFYGGFADAERERLVILPSYLDGYDETSKNLLEEYFPAEAEELITAVKLSGSGYRELSHRDYLGSILGLGVERDAIGDIIVLDSHTAYAFVLDSIAKLILEGLERIGSDKVKAEKVNLGEDFTYRREFISISDTVASARLDCVVASLTNLSRDKAQKLVESGLCQFNYVEEDRCDRAVKSGDIITLRGYGKFIVRDISGQTKKGRLRLLADKYA